MIRDYSVLGLLLLVGACATAGTGGERSPRDIITRTQLEQSTASTAYEAIERLHPQWFQLRGQQSLSGRTDLVVYLNNARMGGRESLRGISLAGVEYIQRFDAPAATVRWGIGHAAGAILVSTVEEME
jgi:hypothetical protein